MKTCASRRLFPIPLLVPEVIDDAADTHADEAFQDPDDYETHHDPFGNLQLEGRLYEFSEAQTDDQDDDGG